MNKEGLSYIEDNKSRKLFYRFTLSSVNPNNAPLLVILHGHGTGKATKFQHKMWNVLTPIDDFGYENKGSWWLGEEGDFFVKDLLHVLIKQISEKYNCENNIYIYGSSMGGYGAILHGILCSARAVYANVPQIKLLNTIYSQRMMNKYFSALFSDTVAKENDLTNYLINDNNEIKFPTFYLCENVVSGKNAYENYLIEHTYYFINKCLENNIKFHLELLPKDGHDKNYGLGEVLDKFERFTPVILNESNKRKYESLNFSLERLHTEWFLSPVTDKVKMETNLVKGFVDSNEKIYLISGGIAGKIKPIQYKNYLCNNIKKLIFKYEISLDEDVDLKLTINQFGNSEYLKSKSYKLCKGNNTIIIPVDELSTSFKLIFTILGYGAFSIQHIDSYGV